LFALTAASSLVAARPAMNVSDMWCDRSEIDTPSCQAACSCRHPAYSGSITSGVQGGEPGFHSSATGDPAWSMPS
jgi:hypothetical protein